jgi:oligopeptidase B
VVRGGGERRSDPYHWLRQRDDPRTLAYLKAENDWSERWFAPRAALRETLYQEMLARVKQDDESVPARRGDWWYSSRVREGDQYPVYLRRPARGDDRHLDPEAP